MRPYAALGGALRLYAALCCSKLYLVLCRAVRCSAALCGAKYAVLREPAKILRPSVACNVMIERQPVGTVTNQFNLLMTSAGNFKIFHVSPLGCVRVDQRPAQPDLPQTLCQALWAVRLHLLCCCQHQGHQQRKAAQEDVMISEAGSSQRQTWDAIVRNLLLCGTAMVAFSRRIVFVESGKHAILAKVGTQLWLTAKSSKIKR